MPMNRLPRDYSHEPTILDSRTVHAFVRELLDYANANRTWGVEVAETLVDLIATRLSDTYSSLDAALAREVLSGIQANWSPEPLAYVDALCTVLANLGDTRPFLREKLATSQTPEVRALLADTLMELDRGFADGDPDG
jgi:predicted RecB family endonuclease